MKKLNGTVAVVSGATSGIGKAIAHTLQANGVKVLNISKDSTKTECYRDYVCNIADDEQLQSTVEKILEEFCQIDFLFCNAGFGIGGSVQSADIGAIDSLFNVNLIAHIKMTKLLLPAIRNCGKIIYTGSLASIIPLPFQACYSASKAGIENFARALNTELKPRRIQVCTIMPGDISTGFTDARIKPEHCTSQEQQSIRKMEKAETSGDSPNKVAKVALKLLKKRKMPLRVSVGFGNKLLSVLVKFLPIRFVNFFVSKIYI